MGFLVMSVFGAAFKEGKTVLSKDYKVDITRMSWGTKDKETDRIMGTARLYVTSSEEYYSPISLTFDVFSKNAVSNAPVSVAANGKPIGPAVAPQAEKIDSFEITIDFRKYGYRVMRVYIEGDFCVDLARNKEANRLTLSNVLCGGAFRLTGAPYVITSGYLHAGASAPGCVGGWCGAWQGRA
ncbi:MAG: hypothetical protein ACOYOU_02395 [Kiritimatiellia bacterium]